MTRSILFLDFNDVICLNKTCRGYDVIPVRRRMGPTFLVGHSLAAREEEGPLVPNYVKAPRRPGPDEPRARLAPEAGPRPATNNWSAHTRMVVNDCQRSQFEMNVVKVA